ncbi:MAG: hypothetical protein A7316_08385 [Candidatus Altiarchaeales archaeon WOR_SM1_86-2]|nr:MAG: hypothetical protein A7316_08385 [Candidatus Altiarchaeales archaeon WOR_SM1_86-2]
MVKISNEKWKQKSAHLQLQPINILKIKINKIKNMKYISINAFDIPDAWLQIVESILKYGDVFDVGRGSEITRTRAVALGLEISNPEIRPLAHPQAPFTMKYVEEYALEYLFIGDKHEGEEYTYGERLRKPIDQIEKVIEKYKEEKNDRQNTMVIRRPEDLDSPDPPCLTVMDTEILDNKLHFIVYFRSWDAYAGFPANIAGFQLLKEYMASEIGVEPGKTMAFSKNIHLYERQISFAEQLVYGKSERPRFFKEKSEK